MSTKPTLVNPTNDQISAAVAEFVAGWKRTPEEAKSVWCTGKRGPGRTMFRNKCSPFATSADAVLPLLEKYGAIASRLPLVWSITLAEKTPDDGQIYSVKVLARAKATTFPLAACIALLRAHGVDVTFTNPTQEDKA